MKRVIGDCACLWVGVFALLLSGCSRTPSQEEIAAVGLKQLAVAQQFESLFPRSQHFVSYLSGKYGTPTWNSRAGLYGRYLLTMQVAVRIRGGGSAIDATGEPVFYLEEVTEVQDRGNGQHAISSAGQTVLSAADWARLVQAHRDFSVLGIRLTTDHPVPHFEDIAPR